MPISNGTFTVPNNFVQQYDQGQKKIRADLMDENFSDVAAAINTLLTDDANTVHLTGAETISGNKTFTGTNAFGANTTGVTATAGDNSTKYATTAYADAAAAAVSVFPSSSTPAARSADGAAGSSTTYARADHSHPNNWGSTAVTATSPAVVVETWHSGTEWYRVWSDNFIEQGGVTQSSVSTNFYKPYTNTPSVNMSPTTNFSTHANANLGNAISSSTTNFIIYINTADAQYNVGSAIANKDCAWYACGY